MHLARLAWLGTLLLWSGRALATEGLPVPLATYLESVADRGVPVGPVELKAREGLAKGIPQARLQPVLDRLVVSLEEAAALQQSSDVPFIEATAAALRAGAGAGAIRRVSDVGQVSQVRALQTLADLLRTGFSEGDAVRLVVAAAQAPDPQTVFLSMSGAAGKMVSDGMPASMAAAHLTAIVSGTAPSSTVPVGPGKADPPGYALGHDKAGNNGQGNGSGKDR